MRNLLFFSSFIICGYAAPPQLGITGGESVTIENYPYQLSLQTYIFNKWCHHCGGSLISSNWIITTAHCLLTIQPIRRIVAGIDDFNHNETIQIRYFNIFDIVVHPNYTRDNINDIALIKVNEPFRINDNIRPIHISKVPCTSHDISIFTGFGVTNNGPKVEPSKTLQKAELKVLDYQACQKLLTPLYGDNFDYWDDMHVCTVGNAGPCLLDDGGPLVQDGRLIGVLSWLPSTCSGGSIPTIFIKVGSYVDFIESYVDDLPPN